LLTKKEIKTSVLNVVKNDDLEELKRNFATSTIISGLFSRLPFGECAYFASLAQGRLLNMFKSPLSEEEEAIVLEVLTETQEELQAQKEK